MLDLSQVPVPQSVKPSTQREDLCCRVDPTERQGAQMHLPTRGGQSAGKTMQVHSPRARGDDWVWRRHAGA